MNPTSTSFRKLAATALSALALAASALTASAEPDAYLKLEGVKGEARQIELRPDGTFETGRLSAGQYSFSWGMTKSGAARIPGGAIVSAAVSYSLKSPRDAATGQASGLAAPSAGIVSPRDPASGQASGKRTAEVVSPRDAASGLPTGKRQHKPMVITKTFDKASPQLITKLGVITVDEDCDGYEGKVELKSADGKAVSMATWDLAVGKK